MVKLLKELIDTLLITIVFFVLGMFCLVVSSISLEKSEERKFLYGKKTTQKNKQEQS